MSESNTATITESDVLDALAVGFEQVSQVDLSALRRLKAAQRAQGEKPLTGKALEEACQGAMRPAREALQRKCPEASEVEIMGAINAVVDAPLEADRPFDVLDPCKAGELQRPRFLLDDLLYRGKLHLLFGREGTNKTMLIIWALATLANQCKQVLLIEYEMDADAVGVQLEEMGFNREALRPYFHQIAPNEPFSAALLDQIIAAFPHSEAVALDNVAEAIASAGGGSNGDENTARDALIVLAPLRDLAHSENGPAVIAADHLPHARENAARGSTAKGALTDVAFQVETPHPVTRSRQGDIKLTCRKDRPSLLGKGYEIWHTVGDGEGNLPIKRIATPGDLGGELTEDGTTMIVKLENYATANPGHEWLSKAKVYEVCGFAKSRKRDLELQRLANDSTQPIEQRTQARGDAAATTLYRFCEVEDCASVLGL